MVEHLQSGDQAMAPEDSAWQAMSHFSEIGCNNTLTLQNDTPHTESCCHSNKLGIQKNPAPALVAFANAFYNCPPLDIKNSAVRNSPCLKAWAVTQLFKCLSGQSVTSGVGTALVAEAGPISGNFIQLPNSLFLNW